jgi:hypothetical protein
LKFPLLLLLEDLGFFLFDGKLDALTTWKSDPGLSALTHDKHVVQTGGEVMTTLILQVDDIERTRVFLLGRDDADTTHIGTTNNHANVSNIESDVIQDFASIGINFDGVVHLDEGVGVLDSAAIVGDEIRDDTSMLGVEWVATDGGLFATGNSLDAAQLVLSLIRVDAVKDKATFGIIQETEVLVRALDADDILETGRIVQVCSDFAVNLDETSHADHQNLTPCECVLKTVSEDKRKRKTFPHFVRTSGRARGPDAAQLVEHPVLRGI